MSAIYTIKQKEDVLEAYKQGLSYKEIFELTGVKRGTISTWVKQAGLTLRHSRNPKAVKTKRRKCSFCGQVLDKTFKYCPNCGKDVRSEGQKLINDLRVLYELIPCMPQADRDSVRDITNRVKAYIERNEK